MPSVSIHASRLKSHQDAAGRDTSTNANPSRSRKNPPPLVSDIEIFLNFRAYRSVCVVSRRELSIVRLFVVADNLSYHLLPPSALSRWSKRKTIHRGNDSHRPFFSQASLEMPSCHLRPPRMPYGWCPAGSQAVSCWQTGASQKMYSRESRPPVQHPRNLPPM